MNRHQWLSRLHPLIHILAALTPLAWHWGLTGNHPTYPLILICVLFGLLPDIDSHTSTLGRLFPFLSKPLEKRFGHRTLTHSLFSLTIIALLSFLLFQPDWIWLTAAYATHLIVDMIFGAGIPLLWPYPVTFYFLQLKSKTNAELIFGLLLTVGLFIPFAAPAVSQRIYTTVTLDTPILPTPIPTPAIPANFSIIISNVYSIDDEILVRPGDTITVGQKIASLDTYRILEAKPANTPTVTATSTRLAPTSPPIPTSTPYPTIAPLVIQQLENERNLARAKYRAAVATPTPNVQGISLVTEYDYQISEHLACVQWWIDDGNPEAWQRYTCEQAANELILTRDALLASMEPAAIRPEDADILRLELEKSELRYQQAIAQLTPRPTMLPTSTPTPTSTTTPQPPTATPTPLPLADKYTVYSQITGEVGAINLKAVNGNSVSVEIIVLIDPADPLFFNPFDRPIQNRQSQIGNRLSAQVIRVVDGDTIVVQLDGQTSLGDREETVRLLGIDAPESVHPTKLPECYGAESSTYLKSLLPAGTTVHLELDPQTGERDRYGRLLAHVWLSDGTLVNEAILLGGYARFENFGNPTKWDERYVAGEAAAKMLSTGHWQSCV